MRLPFASVRVSGNRAYVSGHGPVDSTGALQGLGKVGADLTVEEGYASRAPDMPGDPGQSEARVG